MAPSPARSKAALVFFVLEWRMWLVGILNLKQIDFLFRNFCAKLFQAGLESLLELFWAVNVFDKAASCCRITPFAFSSLKSVETETDVGPVYGFNDLPDVFPGWRMRRPTQFSQARRNECGASMSAKVLRSEASWAVDESMLGESDDPTCE